MKLFWGMAAVTLAVCTIAFAQEPAYEAKASGKQIMQKLVGPNNGAIGGMRKAGGPQSDDDWAASQTAAAILAEAGQILQMGDRPKTEAWTDGAQRLTAGASAMLTAAAAKDGEAWTAAAGQIGQGCRTCHKVHRQR